jgi:hypothetical protein
MSICGASIVGAVMVAQALTISPARMEVAGDPGVTVEKEFLLVNEQATTETFYTSVQNFDAQGETGTPNFSDSKEGLASWIKVAETITLKPGERVKVPFTLDVPANADAGGHFAAIFLTTTPPATTEGGQVAIGAKVGMLVLLTVSGEIKEGGGVKSFSLKDNVKFVTSLPVTFVYRFTNSGNDRVKPEGNISIRNSLYFTTETLNANPQLGNILPNSTRRFEVTWGGETIDKAAPFMDQVKHQWKNFALGAYFTSLDLTFGTQSSSSSMVFFVLPWQLMTVMLIIALIVIIVLGLAIKRYNKWIIKQAKMHAK